MPPGLYYAQWLENHVRKPLEGTMLDRYLFLPAKRAYCRATKLS